MSTVQPCIICNQPVARGTGILTSGALPNMHSKCARRALSEAGGGLDRSQLNEAAVEVIRARVRLGRATSGMPFELLIAVVGMMMCDALEQIRKHAAVTPELADLLLDQARDMGETIAKAATR